MLAFFQTRPRGPAGGGLGSALEAPPPRGRVRRHPTPRGPSAETEPTAEGFKEEGPPNNILFVRGTHKIIPSNAQLIISVTGKIAYSFVSPYLQTKTPTTIGCSLSYY